MVEPIWSWTDQSTHSNNHTSITDNNADMKLYLMNECLKFPMWCLRWDKPILWRLRCRIEGFMVVILFWKMDYPTLIFIVYTLLFLFVLIWFSEYKLSSLLNCQGSRSFVCSLTFRFYILIIIWVKTKGWLKWES